MSFSAVASYSNHKGSDIFEQSCEDMGADFFDQFLTFDPIDNEGPDYSVLQESTHLEKSTQRNGIGASSSLRDSEGKDATAQEPGWHWAFGQKPALTHHTSAPGSHFYSELSGRAAISDSELLNLENITLGSPTSLLSPQPRPNSLPSRTSAPTPTTAPIARRRACITESIPRIFKKAVSFDKSLRSPIRKQSSPKMVRGSQSFKNSLEPNSKFQFDLEHPMIPLSPPQSSRVSDASEASSSAKLVSESNRDVFTYSNGLHQQFNGRLAEYNTPLAIPVLDGQHSRHRSGQQPFSDAMHVPETPQIHQRSGTWSQLSGSSDFNNYVTPAIHTPETDSPMWWNHAATAPMAQPAPTALHFNPRRATRSLANHLQNDLPFESNGLSCSSTSKTPTGFMVQMPGSPVQQSFVITSPNVQSPHVSQQGYLGHPQTQPRQQYPPPPRPYVPRAAVHPQHSSPIRKGRPALRESESLSPKTPSSAFHVRKCRRTKASKNTPRTPGTGAVDFVNFTPNDSRKILTGVAPSGSSKTKARREKEAMEKRQKLSMAALRAVRAAGGDVDSLVEQGLFV